MNLKSALQHVLGINKIVDKKVLAAVVKEMNSRRALNWTPKSIYRTRADVKTWNDALSAYNSVEDPVTYLIQNLYDEIRLDALLTSQIENRKQQVLSAGFSLKNESGEINKELTEALAKSAYYHIITDLILEKKYVGYNMIELSVTGAGDEMQISVTKIPRTNFNPNTGLFYSDYSNTINPVKYRELPEYGKWIIEFTTGDIGLLNKAIPHVLFKRFAQSCWSELCEIYGIPPRVMKTNTQDPSMLSRAEQMMRDMGAAAWFIIDETESFEFAQASGTLSGDVYNNLIRLCNNENSMLIAGAIIGQDTVNGNRSKDESAQEVLYELVKSDMETVEQDWNNIVIPALVKIGAMPAGLRFEFNPFEDIEQLFKFTTGLLPFKDIDDAWIEEKFGVKVIGNRMTSPDPSERGGGEEKVKKALDKKLSAFFD